MASQKQSKRAPDITAQPPRCPLWLAILFLGTASIALYWPCLGHDFVYYDDNQYVVENPHVTTGLSIANIAWAFTSGYAYNWHPVTWVSHMLDCQLYGLHAWGHHLTNILLHTLNTILVFLFLRLATGALWRSLIVAALFGFHPTHVESVAWVAERKDLLSTTFGLIALTFYVHYARKRTPQWSMIQYSLCLGFFVLGLMCKPMLVTWPCVMLLLDYWPLNRLTPGRLCPLLWEKAPFFAVAATSGLVTFLVQQHGGAVSGLTTLSLSAREANAIVSYGRYLGKLAWPSNLAALYPHPGYWPAVTVAIATLAIVTLSIIFAFQRARRPFLLVGWLWFLGTLIPVIGLIQVGRQAMADRYLYIPSIGIFIVTVWGSAMVLQRLRLRTTLTAIAATAVLISCAAVTRQQLSYWQNYETLFNHTIAVAPDNYLARNVLAAAYFASDRLNEATDQCNKALQLRPDDADAFNTLSIIFRKQGRYDDAVAQSLKALQIEPNNPDFLNDSGAAYASKGMLANAIASYRHALELKPAFAMAHNNLGVALARQGQLDQAISEYHHAIQLNPYNGDFQNNLGAAEEACGRLDQAAGCYQQALHLQPNDTMAAANFGNVLWLQGRLDDAIAAYTNAIARADAEPKTYENLALAYLAKGQTADAINSIHQAIRLDPTNAKAHYILGIALVRNGDFDGGITQYTESLRLSPQAPEVQNDLGAALAELGRLDEAISHYEVALRLDPTNSEVHGNLGAALFQHGQKEQALKHFREAVRLAPDNSEAQNNLAKALELIHENSTNPSSSASPKQSL